MDIGIYTWADGRRYEGLWEDNKMLGEGAMLWPDGRSHRGSYVDDKKHGKGIYHWYYES